MTLNVTGEPHSPFPETKPVDIKLDLKRKLYSYPIRDTIEGHETITVSMAVGSSESVQGSATVTIVYDADRTHKVEKIKFTIKVPRFLGAVEDRSRTVEEGGCEP